MSCADHHHGQPNSPNNLWVWCPEQLTVALPEVAHTVARMELLRPARRLLRRPDLRHMNVPRLSGAPLDNNEVDYDDLVVHRTWRTWDENSPETVDAFMYELSQRDPGPKDEPHHHYFKAVKFLRVTRVPRYLRQTQGGGNGIGTLVFAQQREMLAALREQGVLFLNMVAKSPKLPLVFAWGVQATGESPEEALQRAHESYAVLRYQVEGTYQQLEYKPLSLTEAEHLARYQSEWRHIAAARGRPQMLGDGHAGASTWLDGNRTDVESSANALEQFIRGMGDKSFMLNLISVPVSPLEMTGAWRNLAKRLSDIRSEQEGSRSVNAGVALPLGIGTSLGDTHGTSHSTGASHGLGVSEAASVTETIGASESLSLGENASISETQQVSEAIGHSVGQSQSVADSVSQSQTFGESESLGMSEQQSQTFGETTAASESVQQGQSLTHSQAQAQSMSESVSQGESMSVSESAAFGTTQGVSAGQSLSETVGQSLSEGQSASTSVTDGLTHGVSEGENFGSNLSRGVNGSMTESEGMSGSRAESLGQNLGQSEANNYQVNDSESRSDGASARAGIPGFAGSFDTGTSEGFGRAFGDTGGVNHGLSGSLTNTEGFNFGQSETIGESVTAGESMGRSSTESLSATQSRGVTEGLTQSRGVSHGISEGQTYTESLGQSLTQSQGVTQAASLGHIASVGQTASQGVSAAESVSQGFSTSRGASASQSAGVGRTASVGQTASQTAGIGQTQSVGQTQTQSATVAEAHGRGTSQGVSRIETAGASRTSAQSASAGRSTNQAMNDAYMVAMSQQASSTGSLGVVPSFGISISRRTFDEAKRNLGDVLEAQLRRYMDGIESGAFMYQMFLVCPDAESLAGGSGLLKSAFWGPGGKTARLPMPFSVFPIEDPAERDRVLDHAAAFTSYRKREWRTELIEPYAYSTLMTPGEGAVFSHPPTAEAVGLLAIHDSQPVFAMPHDRQDRDLYLGYVVNGERAQTTDVRFGIDLEELQHVLVAGVTGSGKTTTLKRLLTEAVSTTRTVTRQDPDDPNLVDTKEVPAGALILDWMTNFRDLAGVVEPDRFNFFSLAKQGVGNQFRFNLLAMPDMNMDPTEWAGTVADLFMISYGLGEFARSLVHDAIYELYTANRLAPYVLRDEVTDNNGNVLRDVDQLDTVDLDTLPDDAVQIAADGSRVANVFTCPELSRLVGLGDLATLIAAKIEEAATPEGGRAMGTEMRNRLQTVWRRIQPYAPGWPLHEMFKADERLDTPECMKVTDLIDPDRGLVTVIEADGLDLQHRRMVLGSILMSVWRYGQFHGDGSFDHDGDGPGTFVLLEEAHELLGGQQDAEDRATAATRTAIYEAMFRRARALGMRLIAAVQNPSEIPPAITSNTTTVISHTVVDPKDRDVIGSAFNWMGKTIGQHPREWRYLGEMPVGHLLIRMRARNHYLESAPVHVVADPVGLPRITDKQLNRIVARHGRRS